MAKTIIGIAGTNGAGKDTVGLMLVDREHLRELSASWRREFGFGVLIDRAMDVLHDQPKGKYKGIAIASLRNPFEVDRVHELGGEVWWLDADPLLRFTRIKANAASRARAEEDEKTFEQFLAEEQAEMHSTGDEATLNMAAVKDKADIKMQNAGSGLDLLAQEVSALLIE
jgi:hypothetical protein